MKLASNAALTNAAGCTSHDVEYPNSLRAKEGGQMRKNKILEELFFEIEGIHSLTDRVNNTTLEEVNLRTE